MSARINAAGEVEIVCDGDACGALGGRDKSDEDARAIAWASEFHSHVTADDEAHYCPRCTPGCELCAAMASSEEPEGAALPWEAGASVEPPRTKRCGYCGELVVESSANLWAFNLLCEGCFALRFTGRVREVA